GSAGVTAIETRFTLTTFRVVVPMIVPLVAVIVELPAATPVATPFDPAAFEMVAFAAVPEAQVTVPVRSCVDWSLNVPVAVSWIFVVRLIVGFVGVTAIETSCTGVTVNVTMPEIVPLVAVITEVPSFTDVARPRDPSAFEIVAFATVAEAQVTVFVRFW